MNKGVIQLRESFDESKMKFLMERKIDIEKEINWKTFQEYYERSQNNQVDVMYRQIKGCCRWYAQSMSLATMPAKFRHFLCDPIYNSIYMVNSRPVILEWLCYELGIRVPCLNDFNKNYNVLLQILTDKGYTLQFAYKLVLAIINGGTLKIDDPPKWMRDLRKEIEGVYHHISKCDPDFGSFANKNKVENVICNYMSHLMVNTEQKILMNMWASVKHHPGVVLCHYYMMVPKTVQLDLKTMEDNIKGYLRITMKLEVR